MRERHSSSDASVPQHQLAKRESCWHFCLSHMHPPALYILVLVLQCLLHTWPPGVTVESAGLSLDAYRHSDSTQRDPSARTAGDFRQSLAFLHVSHLPLLYILVLEVGYFLHTSLDA